MTPSSHRLAVGGRIDRSRPIAFTFDGRALTGLHGDTLASALLANGVRLVGRSFKYHRPRGVTTAGPEEPTALATLGVGARREPNIPMTTIELVDGLVAESQNRWPSLTLDLQSVNGLFGPLLAAGFYYKTFMGPTRRAWRVYEYFIRKAAGLGRAATEPDPDLYDVRHAFADVVVIGGGPAGLSAAFAAGTAGARVTLVEQDVLPGGSLLSEPVDGPAAAWLAEVAGALQAMPNVTIATRTTAFGLYDGLTFGLVERHDHERPDPASGRARQSLVLLRAKAAVFATGALERPLIFPDNDRPGVMLASAARAYLHRFAILPGRSVVVATDHDGAYTTAFDLARTGAAVTVADARPEIGRDLLDAASRDKVEVRPGTRIAGLHGTFSIRGATLLGADGARTDMACDLVCASGGWSPAVHLTSHLGVKPVYREEIGAFVPGPFGAAQFGAGAVIGTISTRGAVEDGHRAGAAAAATCGSLARPAVPPKLDLAEILPSAAARGLPAAPGKAFVDLQNDVTTQDIGLAHREGYESVEHLKRYTTLGMGTDQGKTSNLNAIALMAGLRGAAIPAVGTTTFRPPYTPVAIGALAGRNVGPHFRPVRRTPMHDWHVANGAEMLEVGLWLRPWYYRASGRDVNEAYVAEMRAVREAAGLVDISTLGKIDLQGPDAGVLLDRVYANGFASLAIGKARYGVMLRDDGIVLDDGTVTRIGPDRYFVTTSTAKAADVLSWLEFLLDTAWTGLRVSVTSVTDEWAGMSVAGPRSRDVLAAAFPEIDVSNDALPHLGALDADLAGQALRILRLSYSGERAYEVYVGAAEGEATWRRLLAAGERFGLKPYGVEALGALRIEKGHVAGPEIDGRTTLDDLGLGRMTGKRTAYVGAVLRQREAHRAPGRPRLVGLMCLDAGQRLRGGAVLFAPGDPIRGHGRGRVTSTTYSPALGTWVALGLFAGDRAAEGTEVIAAHPVKGETVRARIVSPVFLDPEGERLHG
jgi:sarcosine oxidase subunit alpha